MTFLQSDELEDVVRRKCADAQKKGITGVPFTVIDGKWAVSGGQTADMYLKVVILHMLLALSFWVELTAYMHRD